MENMYGFYTPPRPEDYGDDGNSRVIAGIKSDDKPSLGGLDVLPESEDKYKGKIFQWIKGYMIGEQVRAEVTYRRNDKYIVLLESGDEIPLSSFNEYLVEIDPIGVLRPNEYNKKNGLNLNAPPSKTNGTSQINKNDTFDPVIEILKKKKKNIQNIDLILELDVPPKELYTLLSESYDGGEDKIIEYIFSESNMDTIKESVKKSIRKYYKLEYTNDEKIMDDNGKK